MVLADNGGWDDAEYRKYRQVLQNPQLIMYEELLNFDFEHGSERELRGWLRQMLPFIEKLHAVMMKSCTPKQISCEDCQKKEDCGRLNQGKADVTCLILEPHLPGRYEGISSREKSMGLLIEHLGDDDQMDFKTGEDKKHWLHDQDLLRTTKKMRSDEEFEQYQSISNQLTAEQFEVVWLRLKYGEKYKDIAKRLDIKLSAASDRFRRAKKCLKKHQNSKG